MQEIVMPLAIDDISVGEGRRELDPAAVKKLADSIERLGLRHPITVRRKGDRYALVAGRHRIEAFKRLDREHIPACIVSMTNAEARMWEIAENLHRAELSKLERSNEVAEWVKLCDEFRDNLSEKSRGRPEGGMAAASRELGIGEKEVQRSVQIASITPEAKEAAVDAGIEDNQSKLLAVAKEAPDKQVAKVIQLAQEPLNHFETKEKWLSYMMRGWNKASKEWREEFLSRVDNPVMDRQYGAAE